MTTLTIFSGKEKPFKAVGKHQCSLLDFAYKYKGWHTFKQDRTTKRAVLGLERKGCLEVMGDQFRIK